MRNLTICLIAFAVAFAMCGVVFRTVVSAQGKTHLDTTSAFSRATKPATGRGGMPASFDSVLY